MRLSELEPVWVSIAGRHGQGVSFLCPHCHDSYLMVPFANPLDGGSPLHEQKYLWARTGESFETLTLSPSIDCSGAGHWHGHIRQGNIDGGQLFEIRNGEITDMKPKFPMTGQDSELVGE